LKEQNSKTKPITLLFDLETTPLEARRTEIHCLVILDYDTGKVHRFNDTGSAQPILMGVTNLMHADTIIGHNIIGFDIPVIKKVYPFFEPEGRVIDTLLLSRLYHPNMLDVDRNAQVEGMPQKLYGRHSLESYGYRLGEYKGNFGETSNWLEWSKEMEDYCEQDTIVTKKLCQHFHPYLIGSN
tara:strand:+ start:10723 stop:11271 length:549 start_codon:yes stop_codon:yes gene_type:complete